MSVTAKQVADAERRTDAAFKEAERYRELWLLAERRLEDRVGVDTRGGSPAQPSGSPQSSAVAAASRPVRLLVAVLIGLTLGALLVPRLPAAHNKPNTVHQREHAIHWAFCGKQTRRPCALGFQAVRVAKCESGWSLAVHASNGGRYLGMFQFGSYARATYGFAWNPWAQSAAAYRYYRAAGWGPWQCKP